MKRAVWALALLVCACATQVELKPPSAVDFDVVGRRDVEGRTGGDGGGRWGRDRLAMRSYTIAGGTTQVNKNIIAQRILGLPRE